MVPILSCMQMAANLSGTANDAGQPSVVEDYATVLANPDDTNGTSVDDSETDVSGVSENVHNTDSGKELANYIDSNSEKDVELNDSLTEHDLPKYSTDVTDDISETESNDITVDVDGANSLKNKTLTFECSTLIHNNLTDHRDQCADEGNTDTEANGKDEPETLLQSQVLIPKKTAVHFLKQSYLEENSILKLGSIDVDDSVHEELEKLNEKPTGKTWIEELQEIDNCVNNSDTEEGTITEGSDVETNSEIHITGENTASESLITALSVDQDLGNNFYESIIEENDLHSVSDTEYVKETLLTGEKDIPAKEEVSINNEIESTYTVDESDIQYGLETIQEVTSSLEDASQSNSLNDQSDITINAEEKVEPSKPVVENLRQSNGPTNERNPPLIIDNDNGYDADLSESEADLERAKELKAALLTCLKGKRGNFEGSVTNKEKNHKEEDSGRTSTTTSEYQPCSLAITPVDIDINVVKNSKQSPTKFDQVDSGVTTDNLNMPGTEEETERSISPSLLYASCKYRWERNILTQAKSVVFVTINKKEIEPIKLEWSDASRCFYSEEIKVPVGVYVGNLVVDGTFYPAEDITIKHYTFEVDLYLKDDILEDEGKTPGVTKAEEFISRKQGEADQQRNQSYTYSPSRSLNFGNPSSRARMAATTSQPDSPQSEASINLSSKYEELVRTQMNQNAFNGDSSSLKQDDLDIGGRRTPVGEDGDKQYQDGDNSVPKTYNSAMLENSSQKVSALYDPLIDGFFENGNIPLHTSAQNVQTSQGYNSPPAVIDDVLGNGHARTPIYSTESPVYSRHSSAHSSARQTPTTSEVRESTRPESVGSVHSANSTSRHVIDDLINDAMGRTADPFERSSPASEQREGSHAGSTPTRPESVGSAMSENSASRRSMIDMLENDLNTTKTPPPSKEGSMSGSRPQTPPRLQEQIGDVLNPSDRHSPIRREFLAGSPNVSNHSSRGSGRNSAQGSTTSSQRQTPQKDLISNALFASQEKLYASQEMRRASGSENGSNISQAGSDKSGRSSVVSNASSRPQSLTSEQELTQYYENLSDKSNKSNDSPGFTVPRTGSASSLPAIGSQLRYTPDKRSMTPDNHIRVPAVGPIPKGTLFTGRTPPRTPLSNASSRTVTPVNADNETETRLREQIKDLEITMSSVKKQLTLKELEVMELKDQVSQLRDNNTQLQGDLDRQRARASPAIQVNELERKLREANEDKDAFKADIQRLQDELRQKSEPGLNSYDPNGRSALQRRIDDLTGQLQDLQEANEAASEEISVAEKKVKELSGENESLKVMNSERSRDTEDENRSLKAEIKWLRENPSGHSEASDYRLRIELQQVKDDNRNLRERNYQLHDDNMRLKEELSDLRKSFELMGSVKKTLNEDRKPAPRQYETYETPVTAYTEKPLESSYHSDRGYSRRSDPLPERRADKSKEIYTRSTYDTRSYDAPRLEQARKEKDFVDDRFTKTESYRYESYRSGPDGGSGDKFQSSHGYSRTLTPERPSALRESTSGSRSQDRLDLNSRTLDKSDLDFGKNRKERSRTSSAEIDFRSMQLSAYNADLSKTTPALSGRSRAIYQEITQQRGWSKPPDGREIKRQNICESCENSMNTSVCNQNTDENTQKTDDSNKRSEVNQTTQHCNSHSKPEQTSERNANTCPDGTQNQSDNPCYKSSTNKSRSSQVFMNRFVAQRPVGPKEGTCSDTTRTQHLQEPREDYYSTRESLNLSRSRSRDIHDKTADAVPSGYNDDGNMSDTPTDILVNIQPTDKIPASVTWSRSRPRRGSVGSDASNSSFDDIDEQITAAARKRSKSADSRELLRQMGPSTGTRKENATLSRTLSPAPSAGLRSITPRPIATQHNKSSLTLSSSLNSLTQGLRPFAPRSAQDLQIEDVIKFSRQGGKLSQGTVKFIGHLPGRGDIYLGVELDKEDGKHDGVFEGIRYFVCKPNKGVFVAYNKVVMAWTSY